MESENFTEKKFSKTAIGITATVAGLVLTMVMITLFGKSTPKETTAIVMMQPLEAAAVPSIDEKQRHSMQEQFTQLKALAANYTSKLTGGGSKKEIDSIKHLLFLEEETFQTSIDSLWIDALADRSTDNSQLNSIAIYRKSLDSLKSVSSGINAGDAVNKTLTPDRENFARIQDELMDKTNKIALLESSIQLLMKRTTAGQNNNAVSENNNRQAIEDNAILENKVAELTTGNMRLQQEVERLKKQPLEASKNNSSEQILLTKNTALQQRVTAINAELQLVRVDCNLSRVDATQIISNSKQRKQLLSEASSILTDLVE